MALSDVSFEMSLKPFTAHDGSDIDPVLRRLFAQWALLARQASAISVMLWTGDGSEILDYRGDADGEVEWGRYIGNANPHGKVPNDPEGIDPHSKTYPYTADPVRLTYGRLALIIARIKAIGAEATGKPIRVGATFDPGPEFAKSSFKYERHPEACAGILYGKPSFVSCYATLHADTVTYAGFPTGIPEGTPFGTFLGRQCRHFLGDLGYDFIWFSNGFGFGVETWTTTGAVFDGKAFHPEKRFATRDLILDFWRRFRAECPRHQVRIRGTNLTTGIDLSTDGAPIREIYSSGFDVASPPNSPWAALDGNFGMELAGWMSHIAELPDDGFLFRYYIHDPWWKNSPWLDRYGREAHDLWLPLGIARIDGDGVIQTPSRIALLTVDDSFGQMPDRVPSEVTPLLLDALAHAPDAPPPTVWVYPFAEYHEHTFGAEPRMAEPFAGDWLIASAINEGFPLNAVASSTNFLASLAKRPGLYRHSVLVTPVPDGGSALAAAVLAHVRSGGKALLYGPVERTDEAMLHALGLARSTPIAGELSLTCAPSPDSEPLPARLIHRTQICAGGIDTVAAWSDPHQLILATVAPVDPADATGQQRVASLVRSDPQWHDGALAWVRGTLSASFRGGNLLTADDPTTFARGEVLLRHALAALGWELGVQRRPRQRATASLSSDPNAPWELMQLELAALKDSPVLGIHRHLGALWLSGYTRDTTSKLRLRLPHGAPLLIGAEAWIEDGRAEYALPRAWRRECRALVEQATPGVVGCVEGTCEQVGWNRRIWIRGLLDATVTLLPPPGVPLQIFVNSPWPHVIGTVPDQRRNDDGSITCTGITGKLSLTW